MIKCVSEDTKIPQPQVKEIINATLDTISNALVQSEEVIITGFGKFYTVEHQGRTVQLPKGGSVEIETRTVPRFKSGTTLKNLMSDCQ